MRNEFVLAFNEVLEEKQLPREVILQALEAAMVSAYRRAVNASSAQHVEANIDLNTGKVTIYAEKEVVEKVQDPRTEVTLEEARRVDPNAILGSMVVVETTPENFGRVAAQTARQVIQQRIREAEREEQLNYFSKQVGEIVSGVIQSINSQAITVGLDKKAEGIMPKNQQVPGERFRVHDRIRALLLEVKASPRGPQIVLSRAHKNFLRRLLENEVPEIYHGMVEIRSIAREPGQRSKVAVMALQPGVDPVGACVGIRGVRIQAIVRELNDEKIDVIEWSADPTVYLAKALSPARVTGVYLNEHAKGAKMATVVVPEDQLSLAIGRDGQNARLAARLTGWKIDIKSLPEAAADALHKLQTEPEYAALAQQETDIVPQVEQILAKKAEGRPVTPEEYQVLSQFVDRVERGLFRQREKDRQAEEERLRLIEARIPKAAFEIPIEESGMSLRFATLLAGAGYPTVGDLMFQMQLDPDVIFRLEGIGAKAIAEIEKILDNLSFPAEEVEVAAKVEAPVGGEINQVEEAVIEQPAKVGEIETAAEEEAAEVLPITQAGEVSQTEQIIPGMPEAVTEAVTKTPEEPEEVEAAIAEEGLSPFEDMFSWRVEAFEVPETLEEGEEEDEQSLRKKKKKKKKRYVELEYDPEKNVVVAKKKRKRSGLGDWEDDWDL